MERTAGWLVMALLALGACREDAVGAAPATRNGTTAASSSQTKTGEPRAPADPRLVAFLAWADANWGQPAKAGSLDPECVRIDPRDKGWCLATKFSGDDTYFLEYLAADPQAVRFDFPLLKNAVTCDQIGEHGPPEVWTDSWAEHTHCVMTGGPFNGHQVEIQAKQDTWHVLVFSKAYLLKKPGELERLGGHLDTVKRLAK